MAIVSVEFYRIWSSEMAGYSECRVLQNLVRRECWLASVEFYRIWSAENAVYSECQVLQDLVLRESWL